MSSSTKTTQPNQGIQPNHLTSGERWHSTKETNQSKPVRPAQPPNLTHWADESSKTSKKFRPWQRQAQHRPEESQTGSAKLCRWQAQAGPAKTMSLTKWAPKYLRGRPSQGHKPGTLARNFCHWQAQQRPCALQMKPSQHHRVLP